MHGNASREKEVCGETNWDIGIKGASTRRTLCNMRKYTTTGPQRVKGRGGNR